MLADTNRQDMIGHRGPKVWISSMAGNLYACDGWKLLQARIVEGVGWMVWHLRRDLHSERKSRNLSAEPAQTRYPTLKHMQGKDRWSIM